MATVFAPHRLAWPKRSPRCGTSSVAAERTGRNASRAGAHDGGFAILEMVVAVLILAALVALVPRVIVSSHALIGRSHDLLAAQFAAGLALSDASDRAASQPSEFRHGTLNHHRWSIEDRSYHAAPASSGTDTPQLRKARVIVEISHGRTFTVETLHLELVP